MRQGRRRFVIGAALLAGSASVGGLRWLNAESQLLAQNEAERDVFSAVATYGSAIAVERVSAPGGRVLLKVRLDDLGAYNRIYQGREGLPADLLVHADGNELSFAHRGTPFSIRHEISKNSLKNTKSRA